MPLSDLKFWILSLVLAVVPGLCAQMASSPGPARPTVTIPSTANSSPSSSSAAASNAVSAPSGYILAANDRVAVEVFGEDDLRTNGQLNGEGNLSLPLLGSIRLAGLTLTQAASHLTELYGRDYLVNPKVNVTLVGFAKRRFTILGQVNRPGSYEMPDGGPNGIDLLEAIAMAGGYTRIAAPERISVRRHGDQFLKVDAKRIARGAGAGFRIESGDTITVGESIF